MCISLNAEGLTNLSRALYVTRPQIYYNTFRKSFLDTYNPLLGDILDGKYESKANATTGIIKSRGGEKFDLFYKNKQWGKDLWAELLAPARKANFNVETWLRDSKAEPYCKPYQI